MDGGRKKNAIKELVLAQGGGLLMFVDADDWLDTRLVETVRERMQPDHVGAVIVSGCALDIQTVRAAWIPGRELFDDGFDRLCGSSTLLRLRPEAPEPLRRDPYMALHEHYRFVDLARQHGLPVLELDLPGCYVVNTAENHSELHGPFATWRRTFCQQVNRLGEPLDECGAARFGLSLRAIRSASDRLSRHRAI